MKNLLIISLLIVCNASASLAQINEGSEIPEDSTLSISQLDELVVNGYQKNVTVDGSLTTVKIKGSAFERLGSLSKMLPNLPGLISKNGQLEVIGAGKPLFIVDGRELQDVSELDMLRSDNIKDIKIEKNPGGRYSSVYPAVVYISTIKRLKNFMFLDISNDLIKFRRWQERPSVNARLKVRKFTSTLSYQYYFSESVIKETYFRRIADESGVRFDLKQPRRYSTHTSNMHALSWMGEYEFSPQHRLGFYYYLNHSPAKPTESGCNIVGPGETEATPFEETTRETDNLNSFTLLYAFDKGNSRLTMTQDVALRRSVRNKNALEWSNPDNMISSDSHNAYDIYTTNIRFSTLLPWMISLQAGAKYNFIDSKNRILSGGMLDYEIPPSNLLSVREQNPQIYLYLAKWFGNLNASAGLRYEYTFRSSSNISTGRENEVLREKSSNFFPWVSLSYRNQAGLTAYATYSRNRLQPNFSQMNSGLVYMDPYSFSDGNPCLVDQTQNTVNMGASFKNIELSVRYRNYRNYIQEVESPLSATSNIVRKYSINFPSLREWMISLGYSFNIRNFNASARVSLNVPYARIPVDNGIEKREFPQFDAFLNLTYQPCDWLSLYTNYEHQGHSECLITTQRAVDAWNIGVSAALLKKRLSLDLSFNDILGRANYNNLTNTYKDVSWGTYGSGDSRGIWLTMTYVIFDKQINGKTTPGNSSEIMRTQ